MSQVLGLPVWQCQSLVGSQEFTEWVNYFQEEDEETKKEHYYLAQIAFEIRRGWVKDPKKVKFEDFLWRTDPSPLEKEELSPESYMERSKSHWRALLGIKG